jgi:MFS family permease
VLADVREGLRYVWGDPVLRTISLMMALINFVAAPQAAELVLFAKHVLDATDAEVAWLFAAGSLGIVIIGLVAGRIRRRLTFSVTALGALVVNGVAVALMAAIGWYLPAVVLWSVASGFGLLLNMNTAALRQTIVPDHLYGRVISIAGVMAWSAIPLGALAGAALINVIGIRSLYVVTGLASAAIAVAFSASPIRRGDELVSASGAGRESR